MFGGVRSQRVGPAEMACSSEIFCAWVPKRALFGREHLLSSAPNLLSSARNSVSAPRSLVSLLWQTKIY